MNDFLRVLAAIGCGVCLLPAWLLVLCLGFGLYAGIFWFLCTWIFVLPAGFVAGLVVLPDLEAAQ